MKRKKNRWRPLPLFFPNHPKISRRRKRRTRARMRTCHRSSERKFTLCCYFLIIDRDLRGEFGNDFISLCALIYARKWRIRFIKKTAHIWGKPSSSSLFSILSKKTNTTREKTKKKTKERKKWRSTRRRGERATSSSRPLCSVSAEACITTRWRKGGKN